MNIQQRLGLLKKSYAIHDDYVASDENTACEKGCAACCTCNVTATTLESILVYHHLTEHGLDGSPGKMTASEPRLRFQPKITINQMVAMCANGQDLPEETNDPSAGTCRLLDEDRCSIYAVRPFGCRAMLSAINCSSGGEARMSPFMLSVNNVVMQYIEAVDQPGGTGNMIDVLRALSNDSFRDAYMAGRDLGTGHGLLINRAFPVLMVPPEHRNAIHPLIQRLNTALKDGRQFL